MARWRPKTVTKISMVLVIMLIMNLMSKSARHTTFLCFIYLNFQGDDEMTLWALFNKIVKCLLEARRLTFFWFNFMAHEHSGVQFSQVTTNTSMGYRVLPHMLICSSERPHELDSQLSFLFYRWGNWGIEIWKCFSLDSTASKRQSLNGEQVCGQCLARASL